MRKRTIKFKERIPVLVFNGTTWIETNILFMCPGLFFNADELRIEILNFVGKRLMRLKCTRYIIMLPEFLEN